MESIYSNVYLTSCDLCCPNIIWFGENGKQHIHLGQGNSYLQPFKVLGAEYGWVMINGKHYCSRCKEKVE